MYNENVLWFSEGSVLINGTLTLTAQTAEADDARTLLMRSAALLRSYMNLNTSTLLQLSDLLFYGGTYKSGNVSATHILSLN